jgi:hypothetical protein
VYIRTAQVNDAAAIAKVHVDSWRTTYKGIVPDDFLAGLSYAQRGQLWRQVLTDLVRPSYVYVAEDDCGEVLGFVSGWPERRGDPVYTSALYAIYLLAPYLRAGHRSAIGVHPRESPTAGKHADPAPLGAGRESVAHILRAAWRSAGL